jgi:tetratricopeptide (TPR) repeat protein
VGIRNVMRAAGGALLLSALIAASAPARAADSDRQLAELLKALDAANNSADCPKVVKLGEPLLAARHGKLPPKVEAALETIVAQCAYDTGAKDKAYVHALSGTAFENSPDELWHMRLYLELESKKYPAAVATVEAMTQGRGAALNSAPIQWLYRLDSEMKEAGLKAERKHLLRLLAADGYAPDETLGEAQGFRESYAELLADEGDVAGVRAMLAAVTDPVLLTDALFQPRVAALLPKDFDLRTAAERQLARDRALAERHPERLDPINAVAGDLRRLGRPREVLALLQPILARPDIATAFVDAKLKLPWTWDELARAHEMLGGYEEAAKAFSAGAALDEQGSANVSQVINLAHLQVRFRHPQDALKTLAGFDDPKRQASPYGLMEMHLARGCANAAAGLAEAAAADRAYAETHPKDHPDALGYLELCLGRMDDAAAFFIRNLDDPNKRVRALETLSEYDAPPSALPPGFDAKLALLKARPDVKAAISKAGGIRRIPLQHSDL